MSHRGQNGEPNLTSDPSLAELWNQYSHLKAARDELHAKAQASTMSDIQLIMFESETLEPIVREMDRIAMQIAETNGDWREEIRIKAQVMLDYVDMADGDVAELLAISLSRAVLAIPTEGK